MALPLDPGWLRGSVLGSPTSLRRMLVLQELLPGQGEAIVCLLVTGSNLLVDCWDLASSHPCSINLRRRLGALGIQVLSSVTPS